MVVVEMGERREATTIRQCCNVLENNKKIEKGKSFPPREFPNGVATET